MALEGAGNPVPRVLYAKFGHELPFLAILLLYLSTNVSGSHLGCSDKVSARGTVLKFKILRFKVPEQHKELAKWSGSGSVALTFVLNAINSKFFNLHQHHILITCMTILYFGLFYSCVPALKHVASVSVKAF